MITSIANGINEINLVITFVEIDYWFHVVLSIFISFINLKFKL